MATNGSATRPTTTDSVYSIALKIGETIIKGAGIKTHYSDFDKSPMEFGGILEKLRVKVKAPTTFSPTNTTDATAYDTIVKRYFGTWAPQRYDTEIAPSYAKSVVTGEIQLAEFVAKLVNNLTESEALHAEETYADLFFKNAANANGLIGIASDGTVSGYLAGTTTLYEKMTATATYTPSKAEIFTAIRNRVKDMTFANTTYNGVDVGKNCTPMEDIRIVAPFKFLNDADVTFLSNLFNLEKADMLAKIVEVNGQEYSYTDTDSHVHTGFCIFVLSKNAVGRVVRGHEMRTMFVKERFTEWYGIHEEEMFYYDPTEKAWAIIADQSYT